MLENSILGIIEAHCSSTFDGHNFFIEVERLLRKWGLLQENVCPTKLPDVFKPDVLAACKEVSKFM